MSAGIPWSLSKAAKDATAPHMRCPTCEFENPAGMRFCGNCGHQLDPQIVLAEERRVVTVLFADVVGFTTLADTLDASQVESKRASTRRRTTARREADGPRRRSEMAHIRTILPEEAAGPLKDVYEQDLKNLGYVANYTRALSLRPEAIVAWRNLTRTIRVNMDPRRYELVTIAAAAALRCSY